MIKGSKINLRLFGSEEEILQFNKIYNNLEERALTDHSEIYSHIGQLKNFREKGSWSADGGTMVIWSQKDEIIGSIGFSRKSELELSIGYRIFEEQNRRKGYATEALKLFSAYLFDSVPLITRLSLYTAEDNAGSRRLAEKCGYSQEGILRKAYFYRGQICNWVIYSILREECTIMG